MGPSEKTQTSPGCPATIGKQTATTGPSLPSALVCGERKTDGGTIIDIRNNVRRLRIGFVGRTVALSPSGHSWQTLHGIRDVPNVGHTTALSRSCFFRAAQNWLRYARLPPNDVSR